MEPLKLELPVINNPMTNTIRHHVNHFQTTSFKCYLTGRHITLNPLPEVEEDGQGDEQGGDG